MTVASTGLSEKQINRLSDQGIEIPYEKIYLHPAHHAGYYPDAKTINMKLVFRKDDGKILGAQAVGMEGVEKRIDVISMAIQKEGTVFDLEEAELCYAPQYSSAKDPVNSAGMIAANLLRGFADIGHWEDINEDFPLVLDVREPDEFEKGHIKNAVNIPLPTIRNRMNELPKDQEIWPYCLVGIRSHIATRILNQNGYNTKNLTGGYLTYRSVDRIKKLR
jgi:rhodanese-related sulfurtransferase